MNEQWIRTASLLGKPAVERLEQSAVIIFGLGGVGSYACEALARSGVGTLTLVDADDVALSNLNRQLCALHSTLGLPKAQVMAQRVLDINPHAHVIPMREFYDASTAGRFALEQYDYIVDCIDTVTSKLLLIENANYLQVPIISCMGTGNKWDPSRLEITDLYKTSVCPLARVMRRECKSRGIERLTVVYSKEEPSPPQDFGERKGTAGRIAPASTPFVPPAAGLLLASRVICDLTASVR